MVSAGLPRYSSRYIPSSVGSLPPPLNKQWSECHSNLSYLVPSPIFHQPLLLFQSFAWGPSENSKPDPLYKQHKWIHMTRIFKPLWSACCCPTSKASTEQSYPWNLYLWAITMLALSFLPKKEILLSWSGFLDDSFSPCMPLSASQGPFSCPAASSGYKIKLCTGSTCSL